MTEQELRNSLLSFQIDVAALVGIVELLLAQTALKSPDPIGTLEAAKRVLANEVTLLSARADASAELIKAAERVLKEQQQIIDRSIKTVREADTIPIPPE